MISDHFDKSEPFVILENTSTDDGHGGKNIDWGEKIASDFYAKIRVLSADEAMKEGRKKYQATHLMHCETRVPLTESSRVRKGGVDYEVNSVRNVVNHHLKVILAEVTN